MRRLADRIRKMASTDPGMELLVFSGVAIYLALLMGVPALYLLSR